jgi:endonuclease/exonuclease/phosphatase (EEP) superfamily protein YafD
VTFELVCVRVVVRQFTAIVVVLYRPGSKAVQQRFSDELSTVLDRFAIHQEPIYLVGDLNIRLDRDEDPHASQLRLLIGSYGLKLHATGSTHRRRWTSLSPAKFPSALNA